MSVHNMHWHIIWKPLSIYRITYTMLSNLLEIKKGITSFIGGGGKTTLIHLLAQELRVLGTVIITTTTHIMKSDVFINVLTDDKKDNISEIMSALQKHRCICVGSVLKGDKLMPPTVSVCELSQLCDYVLVEADGSKHLPLKAHLHTEPVIPENSTQTILVVGIDVVGNRLCDVTHRYEKACELLSCKKTDIVTPCLIAQLIGAENLHDKIVINKCENAKDIESAESVSDKINSKCIITSLLKGEWYVSGN